MPPAILQLFLKRSGQPFFKSLDKTSFFISSTAVHQQGLDDLGGQPRFLNDQLFVQ